MYKKILLPMDGSKTSDKAFEKGMGLAKSLSIPVVITNIIDQSFFETMLTPVPGSPMQKAPAILESMKNSAERFLEEKYSQCVERGVQCETVIKVGYLDCKLELLCSVYDNGSDSQNFKTF
jgi:nucleotide-binding universal stress UspA family protein